MRDAVRRAKSYINSGADGIMIHSKNKDGKEMKTMLQVEKAEKVAEKMTELGVESKIIMAQPITYIK